MLSLMYLGAVVGAFLATLVPVLLLAGVGWLLSRWIGVYAAGAMSLVMLLCAAAIVYAMIATLRGVEPGGYREALKSVVWAMAPALVLSLLFAGLFGHAALKPSNSSTNLTLIQ